MTNLLDINYRTCKSCGFCAEVCPNKIIEKINSGKMSFRMDRMNFCMGCGQCMAVCPTSSISINGLSYDLDFIDLPKKEISVQPFLDLIISRRSVRNYRDTPVPKTILETIARAISFAPPSFPPVKTEIIIVQNKEIIKKSLKYMIELYDFLVKGMENPIIKLFIRQKTGREKFLTIKNHVVPLMKDRLPKLKSGTEDTITRGAPAMILFHANKNTENYKEDIYIALTYGILTAHALGLGACAMDIIPQAIERDKELRKLFSIPDGNEVVASMTLGYPKYKYMRSVKRELRGVKWM